MDNRLGEMQIFLSVCESGSFAGAAQAMRLTPSAVSRAVARLEGRLGVQLIARTTRALSLTAEGEIYRDRVRGLVEEVDAVERGFAGDRGAPRGPLRINASVPFGTHCLLPILPQFLEQFPDVRIELTLTDGLVELVAQRADIAIRVGPLRDTGLKAKRLGSSAMVLVASPAYLARRGVPRHPDDLDDHACLQFTFRRSLDTWPFRVDGVLMHRAVEGPFMGNSGEVVRQMAVAGGGIARFARFHVAGDLAAGRLVEVLAAYNPGDSEAFHALYAGHIRLASRIRAFLDFLEGRLVFPDGSVGGASGAAS